VSPPAPPPPVEATEAPRPLSAREVDDIDWTNPYDVMLHGKSLGPMRDMR